MKNPHWAKAIRACADPERARRFVEALAQTDARTAMERAERLHIDLQRPATGQADLEVVRLARTVDQAPGLA